MSSRSGKDHSQSLFALRSRRDVLSHLGILLAGSALPFEALSAAQFSALDRGISRPTSMSETEYRLLERVVDILIPRTDTPGALDAGVPKMVDVLLSGWATQATAAEYRQTLGLIDRAAIINHSCGFVDCSSEQQVQLLQEMDEIAYTDGGEAGFVSLKRLLLFVFFSSELGATEVLRFDPIPGAYTPCTDQLDAGLAWYETGFSYEL